MGRDIHEEGPGLALYFLFELEREVYEEFFVLASEGVDGRDGLSQQVVIQHYFALGPCQYFLIIGALVEEGVDVDIVLQLHWYLPALLDHSLKLLLCDVLVLLNIALLDRRLVQVHLLPSLLLDLLLDQAVPLVFELVLLGVQFCEFSDLHLFITTTFAAYI